MLLTRAEPARNKHEKASEEKDSNAQGSSLFSGLASLFSGDRPPSEESLRRSFFDKIASMKGVKDFSVESNGVTFIGYDGYGGSVKWEVSIQSAVVARYDDEMKPYLGTVKSRWQCYAKNCGLAGVFTDEGIGEESIAFWGKRTKNWNWGR